MVDRYGELLHFKDAKTIRTNHIVGTWYKHVHEPLLSILFEFIGEAVEPMDGESFSSFCIQDTPSHEL